MGKALEAPSCIECGWKQDLKEVDGVLLCRDCREAYYYEHCQDKFWNFIFSSKEEKKSFALEWWFRNLPEEEQTEIAFQSFRRDVLSKVASIHELRVVEIREYVKEHMDCFADFIEAEGEKC